MNRKNLVKASILMPVILIPLASGFILAPRSMLIAAAIGAGAGLYGLLMDYLPANYTTWHDRQTGRRVRGPYDKTPYFPTDPKARVLRFINGVINGPGVFGLVATWGYGVFSAAAFLMHGR